MVRIGVIGCGKIAQTRHLPEYAGNKDCKIIGVYDLNFERASEIASQYDATAYSSVEELLADQQMFFAKNQWQRHWKTVRKW